MKGDFARIHILKKESGLSDDEYRELLSDNFGKSSSKDMSDREKMELIWVLEKMTAPSHKPQVKSVKKIGKEAFEELGKRPGYASPKQLRMIWGMWNAVSRADSGDDREKALDSFLRKRFVRGDDTTTQRNSDATQEGKTGSSADCADYADKKNVGSALLELKAWRVKDVIKALGMMGGENISEP